MGRLEGKSAIILGAAGKGNMGQVIAKKFAEQGANVVVAGRNEDELKSFSKTIDAEYALCDITKRAEIDTMIARTESLYGKVDIAMNATGWGLMSPFSETSESDLDKMMDLQFKGPFQYFQALAKSMSKTGGGSIIQISSATATIMLSNHAAYMGTKAGIDHVVRCVANEFGNLGIRANSISPGLTSTPMTSEALSAPGLVAAFEKEYPLGRVGTSEDIAEAAVFLASDACFMTGQNLQVNGGLTLRRNPTQDEIGASVAKAMAELSE